MRRLLSRRTALALVPGLVVLPSLVYRASSAADLASPIASPSTDGTLQACLATGVANGLPGVAVGVSVNGAPFVTAAAGFARREDGTPVAAGDTFRLYSITKTFVAIIVVQLAEEGVLSLDDVVTRWLDTPGVDAIPHINAVTIRQLLDHTSGIYDYFDDNSPFLNDAFFGETADWSRVWTVEELLAFSDGTRADPYFLPGEGRHYANANYLLLGLIIEAATENSFSDELDARILAPLALHDTRFAGNDTTVTGTVDGYQLLDGELVNVTATNLSWAWTAGGIVSTIADLAAFARAVFAGSLLQPASYDLMFTLDDATENLLESVGMGLYSITTPFGQIVGMNGESAGFSSCMFHVPNPAVTMVALTNVAPGGEAFETLVDDVIAWAIAQAS